MKRFIGLDFVNLRSLADGVGRFARQLVDGLSLLDDENVYYVFAGPDVLSEFNLHGKNFHGHPVKIPRNRILPWNQVFFSMGSIRLPRMDILHSPVSVPPLLPFQSRTSVVTVHDLAFLIYPETCSLRSRLWWNFAWPRSLKRADCIGAVSLQTKEDIVRLYGIPESKIAVIYPHVSFSREDVSEEKMRQVIAKYHLPEKYILHVGAPHKRKNLGGLVDAFRILKSAGDIPHKLVLVGPNGWDLKNLVSRIHGLNLEAEIVLTGYVPDEEIRAIYGGADVFAFPSFYEGFGYPPLEAMSRGTPVVLANASSLPEVSGDAAVYANPHDSEDIAAKIRSVLMSPETTASLRQKGYERIRLYSQERMIRGYLNIYRNS